MPESPPERCMEDQERETLAHVAVELRALASKTQWVTARVPLPTPRFDQTDLIAVVLGAQSAANWIDALLRYGYWGTPSPAQEDAP